MTLPASGAISMSQFSVEMGQASTYSANMAWINANAKVASNSMSGHYGKAWYLKNNAGNCANGNCTAVAGNCTFQCVNCTNCNAINCVNCDARAWLQANCNCACTYNCTQNTNVLYDCNCNCCTNCGSSCFLAGSVVVMADGSLRLIEDVKIGDYVRGAYGEANKVLAYDRPLLGNRKVYLINGEHRTTDEHTHMRPDRSFGMIDIATWLANENFVMQEVITDDHGTTEMWRMPGTDDMTVVCQLALGEEFWTINGPKTFSSLDSFELPQDTQLYNLVLDGSHTYFVEGYCVTGFINGRDFDYKNWRNFGTPWSIEDYRK